MFSILKIEILSKSIIIYTEFLRSFSTNIENEFSMEATVRNIKLALKIYIYVYQMYKKYIRYIGFINKLERLYQLNFERDCLMISIRIL